MAVLKNLFPVLLFLFMSQLCAFSYAEESVKVKDISYASTPLNDSVYVETSDVPKTVYYRLSKPERIIIDFKNAVLLGGVDTRTDVKGAMVLKNIGASQFSKDRVRVVLDLLDKDIDYKVALLKRPLRVGIEVFRRKSQEEGATMETGEYPALNPAEEVEDQPIDQAATGSLHTQGDDGVKKMETFDGKREGRKNQNSAMAGEDAKARLQTSEGAGDIAVSNHGSQTKEEIESLKISEPPRPLLPPVNFVSMDFSEYVKKVLDSNPSVKISEEDYRQTQVRFLRDLQAYGFQLSLDGNAQAATWLEGTGASIWLNLRKRLYDGGKKQILGNEFEVVKALSRAKLLEDYDTTILTAVVYYSEFYYKQEVTDFLREQFEKQKQFIDRVQKSYQKGIRFSSYDFLTSQSDHLSLEKALVNQKADVVKTEIAFRQFGHIYTEGPVKLAALDVTLITDMDRLQKYALVNNKSIYAARLATEVQKYKISEREAEGGLKIDGSLSLGAQVGNHRYSGGRNLLAGASLDLSLPLYDSGVRKSEIFAEQIEHLKQRLTVQKTEEDVIKRISDIYTDYKTMENSLKILDEQLAVNEKRLRISIERLEKGLDDYRAVRESWDDLISTKIEAITQRTLEQKVLVDLSILSGMNLFH